MYHTQTPKTPQAFTHEAIWQSSNHHIETFAKLPKHLEKPLLLVCTRYHNVDNVSAIIGPLNNI